MSDDAYASFLEKANQDVSGGETASTQKMATKSVDTGVPSVLKAVQEVYVSESDEEFVQVALRFEGKELNTSMCAPDFGEIKKLIQFEGQVEESSVKEFDPRGQYKSVVEKVEQAGSGEVKVFRVILGGTRVEWWVVSVDEEGKKVVGLKVLAVES
ncbi:hypothetical protein M011DRAFT_399407 [Sporormia fimetaria CBS 119925]|uniref:Uncharacterized protein n=1 Tax=Sporormia fimetaria CBS 119925 TaxID=1340428 RepID=A0A6A6VI81_9PLEO|nr:hypothetical protein M011DRAFT_399407 [Sporormia fimetaria CBS 119925]